MASDYALLALNLASAVLYGAVGAAVWKRRPDSAGRPAATAFALWWIILGVISGAGVVVEVASRMFSWTLAGFLAYLQFIILGIVLALAALMYYLVYIYTGRKDAWIYVAIGYGLYYLVLLYYIAWADPVALERTATGGTTIEYARDVESHPFTTAISAMLIIPIIIAAIAYFSLIGKAQGRSQRFRIAVVGGALAIWFTSSFVAGTVFDLDETAWWPYVANVISLTAAFFILVAYAPPRWVRERLHVHGFGDQ